MQVSLSSATVSNLFMGYRSKQHMSWIAMITTSFSTPYLKQKIEFRLTLFCEKMFVLLGFLKKILNLQAICLAQKTLSPPPTKNPHNSIKKKKLQFLVVSLIVESRMMKIDSFILLVPGAAAGRYFIENSKIFPGNFFEL